MNERQKFKGRGAQLNSSNPFAEHEYVQEHLEGIDAPLLTDERTHFFEETPRKIVNKVESPDLGGEVLSMNPYQGCEHGCVYCYARNSHQYWGFSAGLDFERKIIVKKNAAELLEKTLKHPKWKPLPIMLSGNTDCYQPVEQKLGITRKILQVLLKYKHPVSIITKNSLILRDLDLLKELAQQNLVHVSISITSLDEALRRNLEPRTASSQKRLRVVNALSSAGVPVNVMIAPLIPGLNSMEIPEIMKAVAEHGALSAAYTMVRLNGAIAGIFEDWIRQTYPDRADKVLNQIRSCHGGKLNDSQYGRRMRGEGNIAKSIKDIFYISRKKYLKDRKLPALDTEAFCPPSGKQLGLF